MAQKEILLHQPVWAFKKLVPNGVMAFKSGVMEGGTIVELGEVVVMSFDHRDWFFVLCKIGDDQVYVRLDELPAMERLTLTPVGK